MAFATGTYTDAGVADTETVTIGAKVYTFEAALTNVDGNVALGASNTEALANLAAAINLSGVAGTDYAAAMTLNPYVTAVSSDATTVVVRSKIDGVFGNQVVTTETGGSASWAAATLTGGTGDGIAGIEAIVLHATASIRQQVLDLIYGVAA